MRNNLWLTVENNLAIEWWNWYQWHLADPATRGPEPALDEWDKRALTKLVDLEHSFRAFKKATISQLAPKDQWRLLSIYDIKVPEWIDAGFARHGEATQGGDLGVAGLWYWETGDSHCALDDTVYPWKPNQVVLFMPDECVVYDANENCSSWLPADSVRDVVLLFSQPPRELPENGA